MNETKIILECQKGEKKAFEELITNYYPYVSKFLIKLTANEELSQDLVQETFLKLISNIEKFDVKGKATFSTYLIKIAKNCYLDYLKKNNKISLDVDIEKISDSSYMEDKIIDEIDRLPFEQAQAIKLKYLEKYSLKEIATEMGTEEKTIKSRIYEGKEKIKRKFKNGGVFFG